MSALSSGIGPYCMAIVVNEAASIGVHTLLYEWAAVESSKETSDVATWLFHLQRFVWTVQATLT